MLGAALPALAQAPMPAPMYAPAPPPPAPMMAPAPAPMPMPEAMPVVPAAPIMAVAPKAADDMTGSIGFGIGVGAPIHSTGTATGTSTATSLVTADTTTVAMKYYVSDALAIVPRLNFAIEKKKDLDASWAFEPEVVALFNLLKGASTRFDAGMGLGLSFIKVPPADVAIRLGVPVVLNVEHFFTRWFSMGLGTQFNLLAYTKQGDNWQMNLELSNWRYMGSLFFYTD